MIRAIVAIDEKRGMANDAGIPWDIPGDAKYFVDHLQTGLVLMGYDTYIELDGPYGEHDNYVATTQHDNLKTGFIPIKDAREFLLYTPGDVWNIGGARLLANTLDMIDELYITQIIGDFGCTKFLPEFEDKFTMREQSFPITENGITYRYQIWERKR